VVVEEKGKVYVRDWEKPLGEREFERRGGCLWGALQRGLKRGSLLGGKPIKQGVSRGRKAYYQKVSTDGELETMKEMRYDRGKCSTRS